MIHVRNKEISVTLFILISVFTLSSWIDIVGIRVEVPIMINVAPEGWALSSHIAMTNQFANIGVLIYSAFSMVYSRKNKPKASDSHNKIDIILSFIIITVEAVTMIVISYFWNYTSDVGGKKYSIVLLSLIFFSGLCSCLSSLVYLPYMARFPSHYISALYVGYSLCGLLPGLIGLAQGLGGEPTCVNVTVVANESCLSSNCSDAFLNYKLVPQYQSPRFSVQIYFVIISILLVLSLISFYCLNYTRLRRHQVKPITKEIQIMEKDALNETDRIHDENINYKRFETYYKQFKTVFYLMVLGIIQASYYGFSPCIQPFVAIPYGDITFNLSVRLSFVFGALGSLSPILFTRPSERLAIVTTLLGLIALVYQVILALQSPYPILQHNIAGPVLVVLSGSIMAICFSVARVNLITMFHLSGGRGALMSCGIVTQGGIFCGALVAYALINWTSVFVTKPPCS